jgi:hypothetical protein
MCPKIISVLNSFWVCLLADSHVIAAHGGFLLPRHDITSTDTTSD